MKAVLLTIVVGLAGLVLATAPSGVASQNCPDRPESHPPALLTIKALRMFNQPIGTKTADLAKGPIWDLCFTGRPGQGKTMVIDGHDVTPVPGYGDHGPFHYLYKIKPGYLAKIKWKGVWRTYRFVMKPSPRPQSDNTVTLYGVEEVYFETCWPPGTRDDYLWERAVLVKKHKA